MANKIEPKTVGGKFNAQLAASATVGPVLRKDTSSEMGGYFNFFAFNRFTYYQQLNGISPHIAISLKKLGLSIIKGMKFHGKSKATVTDFEKWGRKVNWIEQASTSASLLCRDGIFAAAPMSKNPDKFRLIPYLMSRTTLIPEGLDHGKTSTDNILQPEVAEIIIDEGNGPEKELSRPPEEIVLGTYDAWSSVQRDILGRNTFGIYGSSFMDPIELSIRNLVNLNYGYVNYVHRYGSGRYHFDFTLLEKLVEEGIITIEEAQDAINNFNEQNKNLSQNEDISTLGVKIAPIDAQGSLDVLAFKKSLETDIQIGLLQTPLSMGDTKGSTMAAGYVSEDDRLLVLEGLQKIVANMLNQAINLRLVLMNKPLDSVWIEFDELSKPTLDAPAVQEMYNSGVITQNQFLGWAGFQLIDDEQPDDGTATKAIKAPTPPAPPTDPEPEPGPEPAPDKGGKGTKGGKQASRAKGRKVQVPGPRAPGAEEIEA